LFGESGSRRVTLLLPTRASLCDTEHCTGSSLQGCARPACMHAACHRIVTRPETLGRQPSTVPPIGTSQCAPRYMCNAYSQCVQSYMVFPFVSLVSRARWLIVSSIGTSSGWMLLSKRCVLHVAANGNQQPGYPPFRTSAATGSGHGTIPGKRHVTRTRQPRNVVASVLARLRKVAQEAGLSFGAARSMAARIAQNRGAIGENPRMT